MHPSIPASHKIFFLKRIDPFSGFLTASQPLLLFSLQVRMLELLHPSPRRGTKPSASLSVSSLKINLPCSVQDAPPNPPGLKYKGKEAPSSLKAEEMHPGPSFCHVFLLASEAGCLTGARCCLRVLLGSSRVVSHARPSHASHRPSSSVIKTAPARGGGGGNTGSHESFHYPPPSLMVSWNEVNRGRSFGGSGGGGGGLVVAN